MRHLDFLAPDPAVIADEVAARLAVNPATVEIIGADLEFASTVADALLARDIPLRSRALDAKGQLSVCQSIGNRIVIAAEREGPKLSRMLHACRSVSRVTVLAPETDWHYSRKPLFLVTIPKAGTHLVHGLARALGYAEGGVAPEFPRGGHWYFVEYSNSHTVARDFFVDTVRRSPFGNRHHAFASTPTLFIYRHPLDILVSEAHYYHKEGRTCFGGWLHGLDFEDRASKLANDRWLLGTLRDRVGGFLPWLDFPNVVPFAFEEIVGTAGGGSDERQNNLIWSIMLKLQTPGSPDAVAKAVYNPQSETFRSGTIGGYREALSSDAISTFTAANHDLLECLGFPSDGTFRLPETGYSERPLNLARPVEEEAILLQSNFMGCNLVRFAGRVYAVPQAAGPISMNALDQSTLNALPHAPNADEVKARLVLGEELWAVRRGGIDRLGEWLAKIAGNTARD